MRNDLCLVVVFVFAACSTPSSVGPVSVPLEYKLQASPGEFPTEPPCAAVSDVRVVDSRAEKDLGKRFVEGKSAAAAAVTTPSDVAEWVHSGAIDALKRAGVTNAKAGAPVLRLSVDQINTSENVLHRSGYEGRLTLSAELLSQNGASCWKDRVEGFSENYGYSGSTANYQETLNHALDRALIRLLNSSEFKKSICSCSGGA